jgi:hypothetical protein
VNYSIIKQYLADMEIDYVPFSICIESFGIKICLLSYSDEYISLAKSHLKDYYELTDDVKDCNWYISVVNSSVRPYASFFEKYGVDIFLDHDQKGRAYHSEDDLYILFPQGKTILWFSKSKSHLTFLSDDIKNCWPNIRRAIRKIFTHILEIKGGMQVHGAAVSLYGKCILIVGPAGSGKTSVMTGLLLSSRGDYEFVGNDRVEIWREGEIIYLSCWPTISMLGIGTAVQHPQLDHIIPSDIKSKIKEFSNDNLWDFDEKIMVRLQDHTSIFETDIAKVSCLSLILVPNIKNGEQTISALSSEMTVKLISQSILNIERNKCSGNPENRDWLYLRPKDYSLTDNKKVLFSLIKTKNIPGYAIQGIPDWGTLHEMIEVLIK